MRHEHYRLCQDSGLARGSPVPSLGTEATRLEAERHSCCPRRDFRGGEPVDESGAGRRHRGAAPPSCSWPSASIEPRAEGANPQYPGQRRRALRISRRVWTAARIAAVIKEVFGISYHPSHICKLLKEIGWSVQKPIRRATQRDEEAINRWYTEQWPAIKRGPRKKVELSSG